MFHSVRIAASRTVVFSYYQDIQSWPVWDKQCEAVFLPDGLRGGSQGWLKPSKGPKAKIRICDYQKNNAFVVESKLPFCTMHFGHRLEKAGNATIANHWVRFRGPSAFLFKLLIGRKINAGLPDTMQALKAICEAPAVT
ncbi:hypothetical protein [Brucella pseudogrignonensis]|uniref:hypothetical protein n=1 Tax=Brucella pseudogrignonensis TaxID=419475 RepID=UPI001AEE0CAD|nr:hypothetical protein [Brucella pseudogrignonensis]